MLKKPKIDWIKVREAYEIGETVRSIGKRLGLAYQSVSRKATQENWKQAEIVTAVAAEIVTREILMNNLNEEVVNKKATSSLDVVVPSNLLIEKSKILQQDFVRKNIEQEIRDTARKLIKNMIAVTARATEQVNDVFDTNPNGLYVKSNGKDGQTFERNTQFVKDLAPVLNSLEKYAGYNTINNTNIQINNNSSHENKNLADLSEKEASLMYQKMIK